MCVLPTYRGRTGGRAVTTVLREQVVRRRSTLLPRLFVTDLLLADGAAAGARLANRKFLCVNTAPPGFGFEGTGVATRFGGVFRNSEGGAFKSRYDD